MRPAVTDDNTDAPERGDAPTGRNDAIEMRLSRLLTRKGVLDERQLARVLRVREEAGERLASLLVKLGLVSERVIAEAFAEIFELPLIDRGQYPDVAVFNGNVSPRFLREHLALPIEEDESRVVLVMANPEDSYARDALALACEKRIVPRIGIPSEISAALEQFYGDGKSQMGQIADQMEGGEDVNEDDVQHLRDLASEAPIIRLVNLVIQRAVERRASDIHIEPFENWLKVRYRIDGMLHEVEAPPTSATAAVISRVKLMAKLNIAERRLPQDGRIKQRIQGKELDLRISTVPTVYGESVVMRLLDTENVELDFTAQGFDEKILKQFLKVLHLPHGIILVTGPTGSGKTTTLYAALSVLNTAERKIITVEDPVEYQLDGINQIQVKPKIGLTFSSALRSIVRQDPDVIMIGEMRDLETASIAVQSALTGHLVLSTLHTNDAASGVTRLLDMGVEDYLLTSTINGILAQRLVRTLCEKCRLPYPALPEVVDELNLRRLADADPIILYKAGGCDQCSGTGYRGRTEILEFLIVGEKIRRLILQHAEAGEIQKAALETGISTMQQDGLLKAVRGITSLEEVLRVTQESM